MSSATADKINYLLDTKEEIRQAIVEKYVDVPTSATFRSYANSIRAIPTGNKTCRFVIGTSTAGWTEKDCDYLCDGVDDQEEINAAIQALPETGGEIKVLDGTYNITATISMNKNYVKFTGNGQNTVFKRKFTSSNISTGGIITLDSNYVTFSDFTLDGNKDEYPSGSGIYQRTSNRYYIIITNIMSKNNGYSGLDVYNLYRSVVKNNYCYNNEYYGIRATSSVRTIITNNVCVENGSYGLYIGGDKSVFSSNIIYNYNTGGGIFHTADSSYNGNVIIGNNIEVSKKNGIYLGQISNSNGDYFGCSNTVIIGNIITIDAYNAGQYSIYLTSYCSNCIIMGNISIGKAPTISGTGHVTINNKY